MSYPIADLHCDLLLFLSKEASRTPYQPEVRCSIPQLKAGGVKTQTLAIYAPTEKGSSLQGLAQYSIFKELPEKFPIFKHFESSVAEDNIDILLAIENASALCEEDENLENAFTRISHMQSEVGNILYISLTWNMENRFGGGCASNIGLKPDGQRLLDFLDHKKIAIDLSHASDSLAFDVFGYIEQYRLDIPVIASHSNFRKVSNVPRNLPDDIAKEIFRRGGIIGLNVIRPFVGQGGTPDFVKQLEHAINLGGRKNICFGADFFYENDIPKQFRKSAEEYFYPGFDDASFYGRVLELYEKNLNLPISFLKEIASENFFSYLERYKIMSRHLQPTA